jgi:hypothetical protein
MRRQLGLAIAGFALILIWGLFPWAQKALAECGASVSSCKSCHEIQKQAPVANKGDWHQQHAFGDFCEFCHSGVVTDKTKEGAHQRMRAPLADTQQSCGACHQSDLAERAAKYGAAAPVSSTPTTPTDSSGSGDTSGTPSTDSASGSAGSDRTPPPPPPPSADSQVPVAGDPKDLIDYNKLLHPERQGVNTATWVLIFLNVAAAAGLGGLYWAMDMAPKRKKRLTLADQFPAAVKEQASLAEFLAGCDHETLRALETILALGDEGRNLLQAVSRLDLEMLARLKRLSQDNINLLFGLSRLGR